MNWNNNDDNHHTTSNREPLVDDRAMIKQERILEIHNYNHSNIKSVSEWKCQSCGNKVSGPYAPSTCPVCNAQDSYVPIH